MTNVGENKDSDKRQLDAVTSYASKHNIEIVKIFYDAGTKGADHVLDRPGFSDMLEYMLGNGARVVLVENAGRFARDLVVQITGHDLLKHKGISLVPVDAPTYFEEETPTAIMVRQILGAIAQFEKNSTVLKLRRARERIRRETGRCEGNPAFVSIPTEHVQAAKEAKVRGLGLRRISEELAKQGILWMTGKSYSNSSVIRMLNRG